MNLWNSTPPIIMNDSHMLLLTNKTLTKQCCIPQALITYIYIFQQSSFHSLALAGNIIISEYMKNLVSLQRKKIFAFMDIPVSSGKSIYLLKRCLQSFQSLHQVLTLPEMGCKRRTGYPWLLSTVMLGYFLWPFILVLGLDLIKPIGMCFSSSSFRCFFFFYFKRLLLFVNKLLGCLIWKQNLVSPPRNLKPCSHLLSHSPSKLPKNKKKCRSLFIQFFTSYY